MPKTRQLHVVFNNCYRAVVNARQMKLILDWRKRPLLNRTSDQQATEKFNVTRLNSTAQCAA